MKIQDNKVGTIIDFFHEQLKEIYDVREINTFVFLSFEYYNKWTRAELMVKKADRLTESEILPYVKVIKALKEQQPIQYILGQTTFCNLKIKTTRAALIPRPETEELVHWLVEENEEPRPSILDVGTGSGCIAIALAKMIDKAKLTAIDVSEQALVLAKENAEFHHLPIDFLKLDVLQENNWYLVPSNLDYIISNPPYVLQEDETEVAKNVVDFEPHLALFVREDPILFYRAISHLAMRVMKNGGKVYFEINEKMSDRVMHAMREIGLVEIRLKKDLNGKPRMICGQKPH